MGCVVVVVSCQPQGLKSPCISSQEAEVLPCHHAQSGSEGITSPEGKFPPGGCISQLQPGYSSRSWQGDAPAWTGSSGCSPVWVKVFVSIATAVFIRVTCPLAASPQRTPCLAGRQQADPEQAGNVDEEPKPFSLLLITSLSTRSGDVPVPAPCPQHHTCAGALCSSQGSWQAGTG